MQSRIDGSFPLSSAWLLTIAPCLYPWCRAQQFCRLQHTTADSGPNRVSNTFACSLFSVSDVDDCKFITRLNGAVVRHLSDSTCDGMPRGWIQDGFSSKPLTCKMIHCDIHSMERQKKKSIPSVCTSCLHRQFVGTLCNCRSLDLMFNVQQSYCEELKPSQMDRIQYRRLFHGPRTAALENTFAQPELGFLHELHLQRT